MKLSPLLGCIVLGSTLLHAGQTGEFPKIPADYLREAEHIPDFWVSTLAEVNLFLDGHVHAGTGMAIGSTAGGRRIRAIVYGQPRQGEGTTTFSGSLGFGYTRVYTGPDSGKRIYLGIAGVHGGEFEGIVGIVNLISVLERGRGHVAQRQCGAGKSFLPNAAGGAATQRISGTSSRKARAAWLSARRAG